MTPSDYRAGGANAEIRFAVGECSLGSILVASSERGVCAILLGDDPDALARELQDRFPGPTLIGGDAEFERLVAKVVGFVEAPGLGLDLPLDVRGTAFQQRVWQALREIPAGATRATPRSPRRIGSPKAVRAVAQACAGQPAGGRDPLPSRGAERRRRCRAIAGASSASARCSSGRRARERAGRSRASIREIAGRVDAIDWDRVERDLDARGQRGAGRSARAGRMPRAGRAATRRTASFAAGSSWPGTASAAGEYKYFNYPLPELVAELRGRALPAARADRQPVERGHGHRRALPGRPRRVPRAAATTAGQRKPTPLLLRYQAGDYNCLHQDVYGEHVFPLQVAILLSEPAADFTGGEFVMTEQRPRMQSRAEVVPLRQGDAVVFAVRYRPVQGTRGVYRVNLRHGVSRIRSGRRHTLGIIFHDAA